MWAGNPLLIRTHELNRKSGDQVYDEAKSSEEAGRDSRSILRGVEKVR